MKTKIIGVLMLVSIAFFSIFCGGPKGEVKTISITALKQVRFYKYKVSNLKVESFKDNVVFDDKICGFYDGHIELGIDFDHQFEISVVGDTVYITTQLEIINTNKWFIDNVQYMQTGSISNKDCQLLDEEANKRIFEKALSEGVVQAARENLEEQITFILTHKFPYKKVLIECNDNVKL